MSGVNSILRAPDAPPRAQPLRDGDEVRRAVLAAVEAVAPGTDTQHIRTDQPLRDQIELDSMDWLNLIAALEENLAVRIAEAGHGGLTTVDAMVAYIASRQPVAAAQPDGTAEAEAEAGLPSSRHCVDGITLTVRPMQTADMQLEADFVRGLSATSRYERFMCTLRELPPAKLKYLTNVDQHRHVALVATEQRQGEEVMAGVARYVVDPAGTGCEFAIAIGDAWQRTGLAGILMRALLDVARSRGLRTMEGIVLKSNDRMLKFTRQLGFDRERDPDDATVVRVRRRL